MVDEKRCILAVGFTCLDIIAYCRQFPTEDSHETRASEIKWTRGGNASNSCTVWSLLEENCEYFGTLAISPHTRFLEDDFDKYGICIENCVYRDNCVLPTSMGIINSNSGTRTIIPAKRTLPELKFDDFVSNIKLTSGKYKWIHFEGRPVEKEIAKMIQYIDDYNESTDEDDRIITSVELEKSRAELDILVNGVDYVLVSKDHAMFRGYAHPEQVLNAFVTKLKPGAAVIRPWGDRGAYYRRSDGLNSHEAAFVPPVIVDTLGAGDTFIAATIWSLSRRDSLKTAVKFGCRVAGLKCGVQGFERLKKLIL
ncbi:ketohexokinase-like [Tubulanus polymorphus]|uniref:ketohexokinase-like n=1 Tax=Tubulanus polymorphus TaxID=672921 RepID=UPI003DA4172E